jgi:hypothetical protein
VYDLKGEETSQLVDIRKTVLRIKESPIFDEKRDKVERADDVLLSR